MSVKGLGKGLSALLGEQSEQNINGTVTLSVSQIYPNRAQPRTDFDPEALEQLADSIRTHGLITPIAVRETAAGEYQIVAGERRWRACKMAGITEIPAIILSADDKQLLELALVENLQRQDLNPFEAAEGYKALMSDFGLTQEQVSERVGKSRSAVANALRLLALPDGIKRFVRDGALSEGHARALLAADDEKLMLELADKVIAHGLNVRQTEKLVKNACAADDDRDTNGKKANDVDYAAELSRQLSSLMGRKVHIVHGRNKGKIELEYYGLDDLEQLKKLLEASAEIK